MLVVNNLSKRYAEQLVVDSVTFRVSPGEVFCLLGANGAGKSTTLNILLGFTRPSSGSATLEGLNLLSHSSHCRRQLMYIPENVNLYGAFTAVENLEYLASLAEIKPDSTSIRTALAAAGLDKQHFSRRLEKYSKGMRQKVAIAFALLKDAKLLLMDEPTSGLDPSATRDFIGIVDSLKAQGKSVLMVTHDLQCAHLLADRLGVMREGKLSTILDNQDLSLDYIEQIYFGEQFAVRPVFLRRGNSMHWPNSGVQRNQRPALRPLQHRRKLSGDNALGPGRW